MNRLADGVMKAAQLACCLEVSGYPKPGNVHRLRDFPDTSFEQFLAGSIALGPSMRTAFLRGAAAALETIEVRDIHLGRIIESAVKDVLKAHRGGNTHLGIALLFTPLAAGMGYVAAPDVSSDRFEEEILSKGYTLESILRVSKQWDIVAFEIVENYPITFTEGLPFFRDMASKYDLNTAIVHLFLHILSRHPDTFIARKVGLKQTVDIQEAVKNRYGKGLRSIP